MDRATVARVLEECGTLLELKGENPFRSNAYHNAARALLQVSANLEAMVEKGELEQVRGIGANMADKITELVRTGHLRFHQDLRKEIPPGLVEMLRITGFGPKRIRQAYVELGIDSMDALRAACADGRLAGLKGFGAKLCAKIEAAISFLDTTGQRLLYPPALAMAEELRDLLAGHPKAQRTAICGSIRRAMPTIKDIDLLVSSDEPDAIMERFIGASAVERVVSHGPTRSSVVLIGGTAADFRVVADKEFPFALHYFTGSKAHNVAMRSLAQKLGLKLNEYALAGPKQRVECAEEEDLFRALGLDHIPPELREDMGEIAAAAEHRLPRLIETSQLTGTFHCHTTASDGKATLEEMVEAAQSLGFSYLGIADHSQTAAYARGLQPDRVREQQRHIDARNARLGQFRIYKGIESDIRLDGSLDYDEELLATFDYVVASIHTPGKMDEARMTERIIRAIRHPRCTMIGHLTGRLLLRRDPYPMDVETILREAGQHGVMIEINAHPNRLDLDWTFCKRAKELGVTLVINPDAHSTGELPYVRYGVAVARKGWLEAGDVFNTRAPKAIDEHFRQRRERAAAAS